MAGWLTNLRSKSSAAKRQYSYLGSFLLTGIIVGVWITTQGVPTLEPVADAKEESSGAFGRFFDRVGSQAAAVMEAGVDGESAETAPAEADEAPANTSNITLPTISEETKAADREKRATSTASSTASTTPVAREIIIATSSPKTAE